MINSTHHDCAHMALDGSRGQQEVCFENIRLSETTLWDLSYRLVRVLVGVSDEVVCLCFMYVLYPI